MGMEKREVDRAQELAEDTEDSARLTIRIVESAAADGEITALEAQAILRAALMTATTARDLVAQVERTSVCELVSMAALRGGPGPYLLKRMEAVGLAPIIPFPARNSDGPRVA